MFEDGGEPRYSNTFTGIDASKAFRPEVGFPERKAPGPILGVVSDDGETSEWKVRVDEQWRVPVMISNARDYSKAGFKKFVWLPVQQQWAHKDFGSQFMPRIGTRVIIDFLYGNPDLPIITGTIHSPSQPYPFNPKSGITMGSECPKADWTQSGWRSLSTAGIAQEFFFDDKEGEEQIVLHTDRDYRREVQNDDWENIHNNQTLVVDKDRARTVTGKETVDVNETRTVTVQQKNLLESKQEIQLKVGNSTITMNMQGIEIKAPMITIKADAKLDMSGGAMANLKAPMTEVSGDAMLTLKGGVVMIN